MAYDRLDRRRVHVVHHGVDADTFSPPARPGSPAIPPCFLCLGNTRPCKNIATAVRALALCARDRPEAQLVVVGRGDSTRSLRQLARAANAEERVRFVGSVSQNRLVKLLHGATALLFPSFVEGFGLPVLEAMSAGCAVIASDCPSLVEIARDAAMFCDPRSPEQFAAAMLTLLRDPAQRVALENRGRQRAALFTWEQCAAGTLAVYTSLLESVRPARTVSLASTE